MAAAPKTRALAMLAALAAGAASAQSIEPRSYANAPVGLNFLLVGYGYSEGGLAAGPAVPLENASMRVHTVPLAYVRTLDVAGKAGSIAFVLPYSRLSGSGTLEGAAEAKREISGFGDPALRFTVNFLGAPAVSLHEFSSYRQDTIVGASIVVTAPWGQYDPDRLINLGTNRWSVKPELGLSKALGPWTAELAASGTWFGTNHEFFGGNTRAQDPIYSAQVHFIRELPRGMWAAASAAYYAGGRTTLNGALQDNRLEGSRAGLTFSMPMDRRNSVKLYAASGLYARRGTDLDTLGIAWQHLWGAGL